MKVFIFVGPTLTSAEVRSELDAECRPPASEGDVFRAALQRPVAIGIVDGYFHRVPAVWHKEILWALSQGILVYGSASMGALRAAELVPFGMQGVGEIFAAYRDGSLEDDDEVALAHAPAEMGFIALSEPMVNIRATLSRAERSQVIGAETSNSLCAIAKSLYYPERDYSRVIEIGEQRGLPSAELEELKKWLRENAVNRKREDALLMLRAMRDDLTSQRRLKMKGFAFEHTTYWDRASLLALVEPPPTVVGDNPLTFDALIDELRLTGEVFSREFESSLLRQLVLENAVRQRWEPPHQAIQEQAAEFRRRHGLKTASSFTQWLANQHISVEDFTRLMREDVLIHWVFESLGGAGLRRLPDQLRLTGQYEHYWKRAVHKHGLLMERALLNPSFSDLRISEKTVIEWYFHRLGAPIPESLSEYAASAGFESDKAWMSAVLKEWVYERLIEDTER